VFDLFFLASLFVFSILCFLEVIVFNEEILLAMCFFSFIFFAFNSLGDSIYESFQSRALKFENDLLLSYTFSKASVSEQFSALLLSRGFVSKLKVLTQCFSTFFSVFSKHLSFQRVSIVLNICLNKLSELSAFEAKLYLSSQKKCVSLLLYPLIFKTTSNNIAFLTNLPKNVSSPFNNNVSILKNISI
jgi:hypothetical protein